MLDDGDDERHHPIGRPIGPQGPGLRPEEWAAREHGASLLPRLRALGPRLRSAVSRLVERICWHRRQPAGRGVAIVELCPAYFLTTGEIAHTTAYRAWDLVRGWFGWTELGRRQVEGLGIPTRPLAPGQVHGRFLALAEGSVQAARALAEAAGIERAGGELSDEERLVERSGASRTVRCPWHQDGRPSLWLSPSGTARCYGCGACGRWRPGPGSAVLLRRWLTAPPEARTARDLEADLGLRSASEADGSISRAGEGARGRGRAPSGPTTGTLLRRDVEGGSGTSAPLAGRTPFEALTRADRAASRAASEAPPGLGVGGGSPPDRYLGLERYTVGAWARTGRGYRPSSWRSDGLTRYLLVDLDGAVDAPIDSLGEPSGWGPDLGGRVELAVAQALPGEVTGRVAIVRTGPSGLQVLVELADAWHAEAWGPGGWLRQAWAAVSAAVSEATAETFPGAAPDPRATGPGRSMRLPGLRRAKARDGGVLWTARLAYVSAEPDAVG